MGHFSRACPNKKQKKETNGKDKVLYASLYVNNNNNGACEWFVDSGATAHMASNGNVLKNKQKISNKEVLVANEEKVSVEYTGDAEIVLKKKIKNRKPQSKMLNMCLNCVLICCPLGSYQTGQYCTF